MPGNRGLPAAAIWVAAVRAARRSVPAGSYRPTSARRAREDRYRVGQTGGRCTARRQCEKNRRQKYAAHTNTPGWSDGLRPLSGAATQRSMAQSATLGFTRRGIFAPKRSYRRRHSRGPPDNRALASKRSIRGEAVRAWVAERKPGAFLDYRHHLIVFTNRLLRRATVAAAFRR